MNKKVLIVIGVSLLVVIAFVIAVIALKKNNEVKEEPENEEKTLEIVKYELQTSEYFNDLPKENKYYISSVDELNKFYFLYSDALEIKTSKLKDYDIFIMVQEVGSGSITLKLKDVNIGDTVNFVVQQDTPEIGTADMAFWYLVALVPKDMLKDVDTSDWKVPSKVLENINLLENYKFKLDSSNKYKITTDMKLKSLRDDGGSYDSIYYEIDLDNKKVLKIKESFQANLGGESKTEIVVLYVRNIDDNAVVSFRESINELKKLTDSKSDKESTYYILESLNYRKLFYNKANIEKIEEIISKLES